MLGGGAPRQPERRALLPIPAVGCYDGRGDPFRSVLVPAAGLTSGGYNARPRRLLRRRARDGILRMKKLFAPFVAVALLTGPALAQSKLDQAIAKADEQLRKGKPEEAVKTLTKAAEQAGAQGHRPLPPIPHPH